jgi:hypothetical protein
MLKFCQQSLTHLLALSCFAFCLCPIAQAESPMTRGNICKLLLTGGEDRVTEWRLLELGAVRANDGVSAPRLNLREENGQQFQTPYNRQNFEVGEITQVGYHLLGRDIEFVVQGVSYRAVVIRESDPSFSQVIVRPYASRPALAPEQGVLALSDSQTADPVYGEWQWIPLEDQHDWNLPLNDVRNRSQVPRYVSAEQRRQLDEYFRTQRIGVGTAEPIRRTDLAERIYLYRGESVEEGEEISELNRRIARLISMAQQGTSLQEFEADRRIMDLQNALLRGDYQGVAARIRGSVLETWRVVHKIRISLAALSEKGFSREEALEKVKQLEDFQGVPEQFKASDLFAGLNADEQELNEVMVLFSEFFAHQKQLGEMIQSYDIIWSIYNRLLNDTSIPTQARADLEKALEESRFGFEAVPPTHREILYHAQNHVVEEARLTKNKRLEASRERRTVFDRVRSSLQTVDPKLLPAPKYTRGAWNFMTREMLNDLHHNVIRSEIIFMRLTAGNLSNYSQELARNADTTILPEDQPQGGQQPDGTNFIDPGEEFQLRPMDYYLFDMLYDRVGVFGTIDPLVAFYRMADSDRVLNDLRIRFDKVAEGRSEAVKEKIRKAKEVAADMMPLSMSYEPYRGWWTATRKGYAIVIASGLAISGATAYFGVWDISASWQNATEFLGNLPENGAYTWQWVSDQLTSAGVDAIDVSQALESAQADAADDGELNCSNCH